MPRIVGQFLDTKTYFYYSKLPLELKFLIYKWIVYEDRVKLLAATKDERLKLLKSGLFSRRIEKIHLNYSTESKFSMQLQEEFHMETCLEFQDDLRVREEFKTRNSYDFSWRTLADDRKSMRSIFPLISRKFRACRELLIAEENYKSDGQQEENIFPSLLPSLRFVSQIKVRCNNFAFFRTFFSDFQKAGITVDDTCQFLIFRDGFEGYFEKLMSSPSFNECRQISLNVNTFHSDAFSRMNVEVICQENLKWDEFKNALKYVLDKGIPSRNPFPLFAMKSSIECNSQKIRKAGEKRAKMVFDEFLETYFDSVERASNECSQEVLIFRKYLLEYSQKSENSILRSILSSATNDNYHHNRSALFKKRISEDRCCLYVASISGSPFRETIPVEFTFVLVTKVFSVEKLNREILSDEAKEKWSRGNLWKTGTDELRDLPRYDD
ncbi:unnamed protein product, partial [Mesorhabditis belari]|uniref:Uncharacterized protein n=1 Tax=Mesorhabditis belari TaxID=2138241 RepID=A0AAF3EHZ1_9BILA